MGRSYMFRNDRLDRNIFVREEALEPHLTYLVPHRFFKLRHQELLHSWTKTKTDWEEKQEKKPEHDSEYLDKEFRDQYLNKLKELAMDYADLSARYGLRHSKCVPFRSSREKAKPDWIQGIPVNLHLSLMSTARLRDLPKDEKQGPLLNTTSSRLSKTIIGMDKMMDKIKNRAVLYARNCCCSKRAVYFRLVNEFGVEKVNMIWGDIERQIDVSLDFAEYIEKDSPKPPSRIRVERKVYIPDDARKKLIEKHGRDAVEFEESTEISAGDIEYDDMRKARRKVRDAKVDLTRYGQISWGAPTVRLCILRFFLYSHKHHTLSLDMNRYITWDTNTVDCPRCTTTRT